MIIKAYIKLKFGFWGKQPVFHIYDLHYWISHPGIINDKLPLVNGYVNRVNIKTKSFIQLSDNNIQQFCKFIRSHYLRNGIANYSPTNTNIISAFINNSYPSYLSVYREPRTLYDNKNRVITDSMIIGIISARPLMITLYENKMPVYYVDNLCVHPKYRNKGIAPRLIQTHHFDTRHQTPEIKVHLFKREGNLTDIVPLVSYFTYMYMVNTMNKTKLPNFVKVVPVGRSNIRLAIDIIYNKCNKSSCVILSTYANITNNVINGELKMYILLLNGTPTALYVIRNPYLTHGHDKVIECCASVNIYPNNYFDLGLYEAIRLSNKLICATSFIIEGFGDNIILNDTISKTTSSLGRSPSAYFLYNYISRPVPSNNVFILN